MHFECSKKKIKHKINKMELNLMFRFNLPLITEETLFYQLFFFLNKNNKREFIEIPDLIFEYFV